MKNFIEIPRKEDYHETTYVDVQQARLEPQREKDLILYHKGRLNLRSIVDLHEWTLKLDVIDEEKFEEWEKARNEWMEKSKVGPRIGQAIIEGGEISGNEAEVVERPFPMFSFGSPQPPPPPLKTKILKVTAILYFSGAQRFIVDDFQDFCQIYDNFLQVQKLDI